MALLHVHALATPGLADAGDRDKAYLHVSVIDDAGNAVTGLTTSNITIHSAQVAAGGAALVESSVYGPGSAPGFYLVQLVPAGSYSWKAGVFVVGVTVTRGSDRGQTLASFTVG